MHLIILRLGGTDLLLTSIVDHTGVLAYQEREPPIFVILQAMDFVYLHRACIWDTGAVLSLVLLFESLCTTLHCRIPGLDWFQEQVQYLGQHGQIPLYRTLHTWRQKNHARMPFPRVWTGSVKQYRQGWRNENKSGWVNSAIEWLYGGGSPGSVSLKTYPCPPPPLAFEKVVGLSPPPLLRVWGG